MSYRRIKKDLQVMIDQSYQDFIQALLSIEKNIEDRGYLEEMYLEYMHNDAMKLLNDDFDKLLK